MSSSRCRHASSQTPCDFFQTLLLVSVYLKPGVSTSRRRQKVVKLDSKLGRLKKIQESTNLVGVPMTMPEGHAILDCGAALDCVGEVAAARTAQAVTAPGETRRPAVVDKVQRFKFGSDDDPVEASFAVTLPVQIGDAKSWIEAFVVPGSAPHLISRRWLSQRRCVVNFDPNDLCLESPEFGSFPLVLHSSGHLRIPRTLWISTLS